MLSTAPYVTAGVLGVELAAYSSVGIVNRECERAFEEMFHECVMGK